MKKKNTEQEVRFNELFKQLVSAMSEIDEINIPLIESLLVELCVLLRLSKAETFFTTAWKTKERARGNASAVTIQGKGNRFYAD